MTEQQNPNTETQYLEILWKTPFLPPVYFPRKYIEYVLSKSAL